MSYLPPPRIRPIAVCVVRRGESILVFEGHDSVKEQTFYRPLGGSIEFGEPGVDAAIREFREEIGVELVNIRYVGTLENIFTYEGHPGHEIVLIYEGDISSPEPYERQVITGLEDGGGQFKVVWKSLADFGPDGDPLYPDGLSELLAAE